MEKYELPLVIFTVLSQMSVGMTLLLTWRTLRGEIEGNRLYWLTTGAILGVASVAAILHLAHPEHAYWDLSSVGVPAPRCISAAALSPFQRPGALLAGRNRVLLRILAVTVIYSSFVLVVFYFI